MWPFFHHPDHLVLGSCGPFGLFRLKLSAHSRTTHMYVIGITGKGKSKLLEHCLFQDIVAGHGCGLVDPHADLADDLLRYLISHPDKSSRHWNRIVYFDPSRTDSVVPFNVLATKGDPYHIAINIVEAMRRTWPKALEEAPRFANIALVSLLTLIHNNLTLIEMPRLLTNHAYRQELCQNLLDPELLSFWHDRYERWGREQPLMIESVLNKVTCFTLNPTLRLILGASENHLDFRKLIDEGKVLIADLGRCDGETRKLLGSLLVIGIEQAALSRKDELERQRVPFYLYLDEFQEFVANEGSVITLSQILSEARKFGLHLTLAHQTLGQMANNHLRAALGNIQTKVVFGVDREDAEVLAKKLFTTSGEEIKHTVSDTSQQERSHPLFYSLPEEWEKVIQQIQGLPPRQALVKTLEHAVTQIHTVTVYDQACSDTKLLEVKHNLAQKVGQTRKSVQAEITDRQSIHNDQVHHTPSTIIFRERLRQAPKLSV